MLQKRKPCDRCDQRLCDYRRCEAYQRWLHAAWQEFRRFLPHRYWETVAGREKFVYIHPDMIRKYLKDGPCALCTCKDRCDVPCVDYWCWWEARMAWLRWRLRPAGGAAV